jgi:hypothetical protein
VGRGMHSYSPFQISQSGLFQNAAIMSSCPQNSPMATLCTKSKVPTLSHKASMACLPRPAPSWPEPTVSTPRPLFSQMTHSLPWIFRSLLNRHLLERSPYYPISNQHPVPPPPQFFPASSLSPDVAVFAEHWRQVHVSLCIRTRAFFCFVILST